MRDPSSDVEETSRFHRLTRPARRSLAASAGLVVVFIGYTFLVVYWGPFIRLDDALNRNYHVQALWPVLSRVDRIGQASPLNWSPERAFLLPLLGVVAALIAWRRRSWRPLALAILAVGLENVAVSIPKFTLDRGRPLSTHSFFSNGDLYPSGHTANMVAYYGLCYYLITHYAKVSEGAKRWLLNVVVGLSVVMFATSLLMRWHWFSDLVGGFMVGGAVLALVIGIDSLLPSHLDPVGDSATPARPSSVDVRRRPAMARSNHRVARGYPSSSSPAVEDHTSGS
jgi:membrane-associated phospholipid phosphatase